VAGPSSAQRATLAWQFLGAGRPELAAEQAREALAEDPDNARAHAALAEALRRTGRLQEALTEARRSVQIEPDLAVGHRVGSLTLTDLGDRNGAERAARAAIEVAPATAAGHALLGNVMLAQGRPREALACTDEALRLDPQNAFALRVRALALSGQGRGEEAGAAALEALAAEPEQAHGHLTHAAMELRHGDPATAVVAYREALRLDPGNAGARDGMLKALAARNRFYRVLLRMGSAARTIGRQPLIAHLLVSPVAAAGWILPDVAATCLLATDDGRLLNPPRERAWRAASTILAVAGFVMLAAAIWLGPGAAFAGVALYFSAVPVSEARARPRARVWLILYAVVLLAVATAVVAAPPGVALWPLVGLAATPLITQRLASS
jgi:Tfp pilus assembly protein PilF